VSYEKIAESLRLTSELYDQLIELSVQKKEAIIRNRMDDIMQLLARESRLLKRMAEAEKLRTEAVRQFQQQEGYLSREPMTLWVVSKLVSNPAQKTALQDGIRRLAEQAEQLRRLNETNQLLVQQALDFVDLTLDLLVGPSEEAVYHDPTAQTPYTNQRAGLYDFKA